MLRQCKTARCCRGTAEDFRCPETLTRASKVERCVSFAGKNTAFVPPQRPEPAACARPAHRRRELPLGERLGERLPCRLPSRPSHRFPSRKFVAHCSVCSKSNGGSSTVPPSSSSGHWPSLRPGALSLRRRALHGSLSCTSFVAHLGCFFRGGVPGSPPPAMMRATTTSCGERLPLRATCAASAASARGFVSDERRRRRLHAIARRLKSAGLRQSRGHLRAV